MKYIFVFPHLRFPTPNEREKNDKNTLALLSLKKTKVQKVLLRIVSHRPDVLVVWLVTDAYGELPSQVPANLLVQLLTVRGRGQDGGHHALL